MQHAAATAAHLRFGGGRPHLGRDGLPSARQGRDTMYAAAGGNALARACRCRLPPAAFLRRRACGMPTLGVGLRPHTGLGGALLLPGSYRATPSTFWAFHHHFLPYVLFASTTWLRMWQKDGIKHPARWTGHAFSLHGHATLPGRPYTMVVSSPIPHAPSAIPTVIQYSGPSLPAPACLPNYDRNCYLLPTFTTTPTDWRFHGPINAPGAQHCVANSTASYH